MKRQINHAMLMAFIGIAHAAIHGDVSITHSAGVGVRAYSLADNYVAVASDLSAVYWNPAGLSFLPVREIQVDVDGTSQSSSSVLFGRQRDDNLRRLQLTQIGFVHALPTSRGGLTFAAAYQRPTSFDDVFSFSTSYIDGQGNRMDLDNSYRTFGSLSRWNGAMGLQIAPGTGVGISLGLVTGTQDLSRGFLRKTNGVYRDPIADDLNESVTRSYLGYDVRVGFMYSLQNIFRLGFRFVMPQTIRFSENFEESYPLAPGTPNYSRKFKGELVSTYCGAGGVAFILPAMTVSAEGRFRAPYDLAYPEEIIPAGTSANYYKVGAGLGVEVPLPNTPMLARLGYSYDEFDPHQFVVKYDQEAFDWSDDGISVNDDKQLLTVGLGYVTKDISIDLSYGYQFWGIATNETLKQDYSTNRLMLSFSARY